MDKRLMLTIRGRSWVRLSSVWWDGAGQVEILESRNCGDVETLERKPLTGCWYRSETKDEDARRTIEKRRQKRWDSFRCVVDLDPPFYVLLRVESARYSPFFPIRSGGPNTVWNCLAVSCGYDRQRYLAFERIGNEGKGRGKEEDRAEVIKMKRS